MRDHIADSEAQIAQRLKLEERRKALDGEDSQTTPIDGTGG